MKCVTFLFVTVFVLCNKYNYVQGKFYKNAVPEIFFTNILFLPDYKISNTLYFHLSIFYIGEAFDMRNCATESFLTDPPTEEVRNIVNKGQRDFSVNIIKSLFDKYHKGSCSSNRICVLFPT